jgi:hypothetical protein
MLGAGRPGAVPLGCDVEPGVGDVGGGAAGSDSITGFFAGVGSVAGGVGEDGTEVDDPPQQDGPADQPQPLSQQPHPQDPHP